MLIILMSLTKKAKEKIPAKDTEKNELVLSYIY